jgi:hypothetical protein
MSPSNSEFKIFTPKAGRKSEKKKTCPLKRAGFYLVFGFKAFTIF